MGIGAPEIKMLTRLQKEGYFHSRRVVVEIGAQQLSNDILRNPQVLWDCQESFNAVRWNPPPPDFTRIAHGELEELSADAPVSRNFFEGIGFEYNSIDLDGSPGAVPLDLNFDDVPENLRKRASLVTNCGTTEHVANQLNAFKIIHDLTMVGGVMIHHVPAQGYLTHGLINYNPKFFWYLSASNGYKWLHFGFPFSTVKYNIPNDIVDEAAQYGVETADLLRNVEYCDAGIFVAMQKLYDIDFVPPIDVPAGSETNNDIMKKRYWTIFDQDRFHRWINDVEAKRSVFDHLKRVVALLGKR